MPAFIGLYYPYVHITNESWLKLAALYWDKVARIVPDRYETEDSPTVRALQDAGIVHNLRPSQGAVDAVSAEFKDFIEGYHEPLRAYFVDHPAERAVIQGIALPKGHPWADPRMGQLLAESKLSEELTGALEGYGLGRRLFMPGTAAGRWVAVHHSLGDLYMAKLAEATCANASLPEDERLTPITDNAVSHLGFGECSPERLAQALFGDLDLVQESATSREVEAHVASLAMASLVPTNLEAVEAAQIIELRNRHPEELAAFRSYLHDHLAPLTWLRGAMDRDELQARLDIEARTLNQQLTTLQDCLAGVKIDAALSATNVKVEAPPLLGTTVATLGLSLASPVVGAVTALAAIAFSLLPVFRKARQDTGAVLAASPVAYLHHLESRLTPEASAGFLKTQAARFRFPGT